jgi:ABC-type antimicrobial peptide transport system permease subunit
VPESVPEESPEQRRERIKDQIYEALPYAIAVVVIGLIIACIVAEPCGAVVVGALAGILSEEALATVLGILASNGVRVVTQE